MKTGFSLLEFLVATTFFCMILLAGYAAVDSQQHLVSHIEGVTEADQKANFRILVLKNLLQDATAGFKQDGLTEAIPYFFTDLNFGQAGQESSFSVALPKGVPHPFQRESPGASIQTEAAPELKTSAIVALAGPCDDGFCWNYGRIDSVHTSQGNLQVELDPLIPGEIPDLGTLIVVEIHGFQFDTDTLYWISPAGQSEPFWPSLEDFRYEYSSGSLTLIWKAGATGGRSVIDL